MPGATVATTAPVLAALLSGPEVPGTVVIGLSLANEGLASTGSEAAARQLADGFLLGLHELASSAERAGASVVLGGVYPNDDLDLTQTRELRRTHARMAAWRWPVINFLERTEAGAGQSPLAHWQPRMRADAWHPNEEGHAAMFDAINLRLFLQPAGCGHGRPPLLPPAPPTFPPLQPHLELKPHPPRTPPRIVALRPEGACRTADGGVGTYDERWGLTLAGCEAACDAGCQAFEFAPYLARTGTSKCELHSERIKYAVPLPGAACYTKSAGPPSPAPPPLPLTPPSLPAGGGYRAPVGLASDDAAQLDAMLQGEYSRRLYGALIDVCKHTSKRFSTLQAVGQSRQDGGCTTTDTRPDRYYRKAPPTALTSRLSTSSTWIWSRGTSAASPGRSACAASPPAQTAA